MDCTLSELERFNYLHDTEFTDLPAFKLKMRQFANNTVDYILTRTNIKKLIAEPFYGTMTTYPKQLTDEEKEAKRLENIERAARRARQKVHHLVRSMGADHMLTLSTRENITDANRFDSIFTAFIRLVRTKQLINGKLVTASTKKEWKYVAVREMQDRGAFHFHIACVGFQNIPFLRACWYVALGGTEFDSGANVLGQVDVQHDRKGTSVETPIHKTFKLVRYLCKYITKTFDESTVLGQRRYKSSREIAKPIVMKQYLPVYFGGEEAFVEAMKYVISIAKFHGVKNFESWNRELDIYILRGDLDL
jgi:hypothetical protein